MTLPVIDIVFLMIILLFAIIGLSKGFVDMVFNMAAPILSIWGAILFYRMLAVRLEPYVRNEAARLVLAFFALFVGAFIVVKLVQKIIGDLFNGFVLKQLNRTLGFALGLLEGVAVVILILILMVLQPVADVSEVLAPSHFYRLLNVFISIPLDSVSSSLLNGMQAVDVSGGI